MKKLFLIKIILLLTVQTYAKSFDDTSQKKNIKIIMELEKAGRLQEALLTSAGAAEQLIYDLKVDQIAISIDSRLDEIRKELITARHSEEKGLSIFGFLPIISSNHKWDTAKIITVNPEMVSAFPAKIASDFQKLQNNLAEYVRDNEVGIVYIKAFAAKTVELSLRIGRDQRAQLAPLVHSTVQKAQLLIFWGAQRISHCITTNYAYRKDSKESAMLIDLSFLLPIASQSTTHEQMAYSEKECTYASAKAKMSEIEFISAKIFIVDAILKQYNEKLGLMELQDAKAPYYPTWGLRDFSME